MRYTVSGSVTISIFTDVEANSPEEAEVKAYDHSMVDLCHQCAGGDPEEYWCTSGELDGEPENLTVEEA